jgi:hypothetical protein
MFGKPSLRELEAKAEQVGLVHAQAYLRRISAADLADYVRNAAIRADLRNAYEAAVADVGDKKAMKAATYAAYRDAEQTILMARAAGRAPGGGFRPVLDAAEQAVRTMLTEEPPARPSMTVNGRPQPVPESTGHGERRSRLFWECARRLAGEPLAQPEARGRLLGSGSAREQLLPAIAPLFRNEPSMIRWVALRRAISNLNVQDPAALLKLTLAMGLTLDDGEDGGISVTALAPGQQSGQQLAEALALGNAVYGLLTRYEPVVTMTMPETNAYPVFAALTDAVALDCIAWSAVALLRVGYAQKGFQLVPEPDALTEPGWYTEPVFGRFERYWDGTDWTSSVRGKSGQQTVSLR